MSWNCPVCELIFSSRQLLIFHVNGKHLSRDFNYPFNCGQTKCHRLCQNFQAWIRHLRRHEKTSNDHLFGQGGSNQSTLDDGPTASSSSYSIFSDFETPETSDVMTFGHESVCSMTFEDGLESIRIAGVRFVSELRASSSVTISACEKAVSGCNDVSEYVVAFLKDQVVRIIGNKLSEEERKHLESMFEAASRPLEFLSTDAKQKAYFTSMPTFVTPDKYVFGLPHYETVCDGAGEPIQKVVHDSWQYVPPAKTLRVMLSEPELFHALTVIPPKDNGFIREFVDGSVFQHEHPLFSDPTKIAVALELYYDDLETANPLGAKATVHKVGVFYFIVKNLPAFYNSSMANIHLIALACTQDIKKYGANVVLEKIAEDNKWLETTGFELTVSGHKYRVYASLAAVNGDNLGKHTLFGLFESFRANLFCDQCLGTQEDLQMHFSPDDYTQRELVSYDKQVQDVLADPKKAGLYGIKGECALHKGSIWWHVTRNRVGDLMHDFLEGVGPFEVKLVLHQLIAEKVLSVESLNRRINGFLYGETDKKNRPSAITKMDPSDHSLRQNAFQFYALFRLLPLLIGDLIPPGNKFWEFYLDLRKCADILFAQKWTSGTAAQFKHIYKLHLIRFKQLFPHFLLIPKHHFLLHYPAFALATGPPYLSMVCKQEMKGNFFKRLAHIMCNFKNVPYTLAWRMQYYANNVFLCGTFSKNRIDFHEAQNVQVLSLYCCEALCEKLGVADEQEVISASVVNFRGMRYCGSSVIALRKNDCGPEFALLCFAVRKDNASNVFLVVNLLETMHFDEHFWCYVLKKSNKFEICAFDSLLDYHPLDLYQSVYPEEFFVSPRYLLL